MAFNKVGPPMGFAPSGAARAPAAGGASLPGAASADPPPFLLPGTHFGAALGCWLTGAAGLFWVAPELSAGLYPLPRVVAVTHLFTLGWITLSILGALYQFLPVALATPIRSVRVAYAGLLLYVPGLALFVIGILLNLTWARHTGAALFGTALLAFAGNLAATLKRAPVRDLTWWSLAGAAVFLVATVILGAALAVNLGNGLLRSGRALALGVHLHLALFGWVLLVMIGVGRHLLPMFLLSHGADLRPSRWAAVGAGAGAGGLLLLHHAPAPLSQWLPAVLLAGGGAAFLVQGWQFYRHRRKPRLDAGMRLAGVALVLLAAALPQAPLAVFGGPGASTAWTAYVSTVILGISLFVAGHYYKIVPFLVWYHRYGPLAGTRPLPRVADLFAARVANGAALLLAGGAVVVLLGVAARSAGVVRIGAAGYATGAVLEGWQMLRLSLRRP